MLCNAKEVIPLSYSIEDKGFPVVASIDGLNGYFIVDSNEYKLSQESLKWISFQEAAGLIVYFSEEEFGIGILKGGSFIQTLSSISLDDFFSVSDTDYNKILLGRVNISPDGKYIVVTGICHYGENIIISSWASNIKDLVVGNNEMFDSGDSSMYSEDWTNMTSSSHGSFTEIRTDVVSNVNKDDFQRNRTLNINHIKALNNISDCDLPTSSYNICLFFVEDKIYSIYINEDSIDIRDENSKSISSWQIDDSAFGNVSSVTFSIRYIYPVDNYLSKSFYRIELDSGTYIRSRIPRRISFQTFKDNEIQNFMISISKSKDETTGKNTFEFYIPFDENGKLIPDSTTEATKKEFENGFHSKMFCYNTDDFLINAGKGRIVNAEGVSGVLSVAPVILYR